MSLLVRTDTCTANRARGLKLSLSSLLFLSNHYYFYPLHCVVITTNGNGIKQPSQAWGLSTLHQVANHRPLPNTDNRRVNSTRCRWYLLKLQDPRSTDLTIYWYGMSGSNRNIQIRNSKNHPRLLSFFFSFWDEWEAKRGWTLRF